VKPGIVDLSEVSFVSEQIAEEASKYRLNPGDLLIGMTGYVGEVGLVPPTDNPPLLNQRVGKFVLEKDGTEALGFIYCLTRGSEFKVRVEANSHGTAQANVSAEGILSVSVITPPKHIRDAFNRFCHPILDRILNNHGESRTLAALRDTLLPKLISGELRVKDAERFLKESVV
ncbi:MAG: restriction endonuclease subunit S, partial [Armatimonadota bacterium]